MVQISAIVQAPLVGPILLPLGLCVPPPRVQQTILSSKNTERRCLLHTPFVARDNIAKQQ